MVSKDKLIKVTQHDTIIEVHPKTVREHQALGWKVIDPKELRDLHRAGLAEIQADPFPYEKLIRMAMENKIVEVNMGDVQEYVDEGWKIVDPNQINDLIARGLLKFQAAQLKGSRNE